MKEKQVYRVAPAHSLNYRASLNRSMADINHKLREYVAISMKFDSVCKCYNTCAAIPSVYCLEIMIVISIIHASIARRYVNWAIATNKRSSAMCFIVKMSFHIPRTQYFPPNSAHMLPTSYIIMENAIVANGSTTSWTLIDDTLFDSVSINCCHIYIYTYSADEGIVSSFVRARMSRRDNKDEIHCTINTCTFMIDLFWKNNDDMNNNKNGQIDVVKPMMRLIRDMKLVWLRQEIEMVQKEQSRVARYNIWCMHGAGGAIIWFSIQSVFSARLQKRNGCR